MKKLILFFAVSFFSIGFCHSAMAQIKTVTYDTVYLDTAFTLQNDLISGVDYPYLMVGKPDSLSAHFAGDAFCSAQMTPSPGGPSVDFDKGRVINIYYFIPSTASSSDSNVGRLRLQKLDASLILSGEIDFMLHEKGPKNTEQVISITVPDTGYNTLGLEVASDSGGTSLWIDAVVLDQSGTAGVVDANQPAQLALACYPNPFYRASGTTIRVNSTLVGSGLLKIYDVLGNLVQQASVGELAAGEQDLKIALDRPGIFFARLFVDDKPNGAPLKITSE